MGSSWYLLHGTDRGALSPTETRRSSSKQCTQKQKSTSGMNSARSSFMGSAGATLLCLLATATAIDATPRSPLVEIARGRRAAAATSPPRDGSGNAAYRRFHANDSHVGQPVPCTADEKVCFKYNLMFSPATDRCEALGDGGHSCFLAASRDEFEHGSGHIIGVCRKYWDSCKYWIGHRMAYDNRCYDKKIVSDDICGCSDALTPHFLGGSECRCAPPDPVDVTQPEEEGQCLIPDFRNPRPTHSAFFNHPLRTQEDHEIELNCSSKQRMCFQEGKVQVAGYDSCHTLLKKGPCPEDYVVVIDGRSAEEGHTKGVCIHARGNCPPGQRRIAFDGQCYDNRSIAIAAPGIVVMNIYGIHEVLYYATGVDYSTKVGENRMCVVELLKFWPFFNTVDLPGPRCTDVDKSQCDLLEVFSEAPPSDTDSKHQAKQSFTARTEQIADRDNTTTLTE